MSWVVPFKPTLKPNTKYCSNFNETIFDLRDDNYK